MSDNVRISLFGGFRVVVGDRPVAAGEWRLRKARTLLKLLALAPGHRLHRDRVYDLLWPDLDPAAAANNLHQVLHAARRALTAAGAPGDVVVLRDDTVVLGPEGGVRVDLDDLEEAARRASAGGGSAEYRAALDLAGGELLPEDAYEPWTQEARDAADVRRTRLRAGLAGALEREGRPAEAVEVLEALAAEDGFDEPVRRALMRTLAAAGRRREALAVYERLRDALRSGTGSDPDPQTRRLYRTLLAGSVEDGDGDGDGDGNAIGDGNRNGDGSEDGGPGPGPAPRHNLPAQTTSFVGRERETAEVEELLARSRLVTLTGPGGCGKTRLALAVAARRTGAVRDGVWFVDLAAFTEPGLVPDAVAEVLGVRLPRSGGTAAALAARLAGRELLLVLDNCEHLVDACAALVAEVLARCPGVTVLATGREPLRAYGERTWRVPSLGLPDPRRLPAPAALGRFASVRLFTERAAEVAPGFRLGPGNAAAVAQICFRLDGMPLALELAAAQVRVLEPRQVADRLDDALTLLGQGGRRAVTRQRTLLATLEWSHRLLDPGERRLLRRLAVFAGSFSLAGVEEVCGEDGDPDGVLGALGRLVDKSLVLVERHGGEARYRLLETIRQYARERLREAGEQAGTERRHRRFYLALAEAYEPEPQPGAGSERGQGHGQGQGAGVPGGTPVQLEADHDNLRAALGSALGSDPETALRLAVALRLFWTERGYFAEGRHRLESALAAAPEPTPLRARALAALAVLAIRLGDCSRPVSAAAEAVAVHRAGRDRAALAYALHRQSVLLWMCGAWDAADRALDEACALARGAPTARVPAVLAAAAYQRGIRAASLGDGAAARAAFAGSLDLLADLDGATGPFLPVMTPGYVVEEGAGGRVSVYFEETVLAGRLVGAAQARGYALANLAWAARLDGDTDGAAAAAERSAACFRDLGDPRGESLALNALGNICRARGDRAAARRHLEASLAVRRRLGDRREVGITLGCLGLLALSAGDLDGARAAVGRALAGFEEADDVPGRTNSLLHLGLVARAAGDTAAARALLVRAQELEHVAGSRCAAGWVAVVLARLAEEAGDRVGADAATARARALFTGPGDARGLAHLRRTGPAAAAPAGRGAGAAPA
ncbi:tetratricopeptide repeat protein [Streptacidiphilus sp. ASG 303]|uniref:BTAD domain-containing putative transcriptional regulator n=1 Tax=Streptacidiphilus sp. ASG 303 TaxID=2896847 RepID=UPI001E5AF987|nr:BTAD domain-containing putative transcriptional regulator [Streptacidiphilus sp. ASG 303]MCD0481059.1 tetratricopeptide repeat protein [Streptacidiphilus sp. ASG 303]